VSCAYSPDEGSKNGYRIFMGNPFGKLSLDREIMWNNIMNMVVRVGGE
jgi:hypothetical protein